MLRILHCVYNIAFICLLMDIYFLINCFEINTALTVCLQSPNMNFLLRVVKSSVILSFAKVGRKKSTPLGVHQVLCWVFFSFIKRIHFMLSFTSCELGIILLRLQWENWDNSSLPSFGRWWAREFGSEFGWKSCAVGHFLSRSRKS